MRGQHTTAPSRRHIALPHTKLGLDRYSYVEVGPVDWVARVRGGLRKDILMKRTATFTRVHVLNSKSAPPGPTGHLVPELREQFGRIDLTYGPRSTPMHLSSMFSKTPREGSAVDSPAYVISRADLHAVRILIDQQCISPVVPKDQILDWIDSALALDGTTYEYSYGFQQ